MSLFSFCFCWKNQKKKKKKIRIRAESEEVREDAQLRATIGDVINHFQRSSNSDDDDIDNSYQSQSPPKNSVDDDDFIDLNFESLTNSNVTTEASSSAGPSNSSQQEPTSFTVAELRSATNNFSKLIGEGGFGPVFKGRLKSSNREIAVKLLNMQGSQGHNEFIMEALVLSNLRHPNLIKLVGFCKEDYYRLLVYEYMPNGSLADHIYDLKYTEIKPLDWRTRMSIAVGAARGIEYLHDQRGKAPIIFRDLKPANILLDEDFSPKLSDFGLAKLGPTGDKTHVTTRVMGTEGYCAPDYAKTGRLAYTSDVFSFGIVLLELISGLSALYKERGHTARLLDWAIPRFIKKDADLTAMADPLLMGTYRRSSMEKAVQLAALCVQEAPNERPTMGQVVKSLEWILARAEPRDEDGGSGTSESEAEMEPLNERMAELWRRGGEERDRAVAEAKEWGLRFLKEKNKAQSSSSSSSSDA